jgi:hypothetical protein
MPTALSKSFGRALLASTATFSFITVAPQLHRELKNHIVQGVLAAKTRFKDPKWHENTFKT